MTKYITLAKKWNNRTTEYNRIQFLEAFNSLSESEQVAAVQPGTELSKILIGWCAMARDEIARGVF